MNRLLIVRGCDLGELPFEMLPFGPRSGASFSRSHFNYMVQKFEISYRYAAGFSRVVKDTIRSAFPFLFAIGSDVPIRSEAKPFSTSLLRSDSSGRPLHDIHSQINSELQWLKSEFGRSALVLMDAEATKENLLHFAEGSAVIHIASHSRIRVGTTESGSILLSSGGGSGISDFLRICDVLKMKTAAQLVVLSSCRTALQPEAYSRTDYAKSFLIAGAASVLASLWDVDDASTDKLMRSFYKHLRSGARKSEALQAAKRDLIDDGLENPYYWASFILIGDDGPVRFPTDCETKPLFSWIYGAIMVAFIALWVALCFRALPLKRESVLRHR